jgi:Fe-S cluster assembly scaffold protein SufB
VHYVEGCTAPVYSSDSLHSAVVEIIVKAGGRCRYTTIQNWSTDENVNPGRGVGWWPGAAPAVAA